RRAGLGYFTGMRPDRPDPFQGQDGAGRRHVPTAALVVLQEDANRAGLRRQAKRAGLYGLFGPTDRGLAEKLHLLGTDHAMGRGRYRRSEVRRLHSVIGTKHCWFRALPGPAAGGPMVPSSAWDRDNPRGARTSVEPTGCLGRLDRPAVSSHR